MCGIIAVYSPTQSISLLYQGLQYLQHRGQDAAGIVSLDTTLSVRHGLGTIDKLVTLTELSEFRGRLSIGHVRYPTSGHNTLQDAQPFLARSMYHVAFAHSGHINNSGSWSNNLNSNIHISASTVDSNLLLHLFMTLLEQYPKAQNEHHFFSILCQVIDSLFNHVQGAYSVVCLIEGKGLIVFRDPQGIRPLVMGEKETSEQKKEYIFASESSFFNQLGYKLQGDVAPGELIYLTEQGALHRHSLTKKTFTPCSFEYIYFARPHSILNGINVEQTRQNMGKRLASHWKAQYPQLVPDYVLPIPNTANTAAATFAQSLDFHYAEEFKVNPHTGRTFINSEKLQRKNKVQQKLSIAYEKVNGKIILLFDDSIVRGTTAKEVIKMLRLYEVQKIYFVCACPPVINICSFGINIPNTNELLAYHHTLEQMQQLLGVDVLLYPNVSDLMTTICSYKDKKKIMPCVQCLC